MELNARAGFTVTFQRSIKGTPVNTSADQVFFEVPAADLRVQLLPDTTNIHALRLTLTEQQVASLPLFPSPYNVVNETGGFHMVSLSALVRRVGLVESDDVL